MFLSRTGLGQCCMASLHSHRFVLGWVRRKVEVQAGPSLHGFCASVLSSAEWLCMVVTFASLRSALHPSDVGSVAGLPEFMP